MIAIIAYVSVLERTKEIGITILICIPVNLILSSLTGINQIASMPIESAIFLILLSILLNVIAGSIQSKMASKKNPVEALRNE